jgi:hypothetical protein
MIAAGADFHPKYSHKNVKDAAYERGNFEKAPDYTLNNQRTASGAQTYPKASSGFCPAQHVHDPAHGFDLLVAYQYPMVGMPGNAHDHHNPTTNRVPIRAGPDRIVAWKNRADSHYNIGMSYHDASRRIPNSSSRNHPFSHAQVKSEGPLEINLKVMRAKKAIYLFNRETSIMKRIYKKIFKSKKPSLGSKHGPGPATSTSTSTKATDLRPRRRL